MKNNESKKGLGTWLRLEHLLSKVEAVDSNLILRRWRRKKKKRKNEKKEEGREGEAKFQGGSHQWGHVCVLYRGTQPGEHGVGSALQAKGLRGAARTAGWPSPQALLLCHVTECHHLH
jgi:hypothetical protein